MFFEGSNTKEGHLYHEVPGTDLKFQRGNTANRVKFILEHVDVKGKRVLDLGCNVGGIGLGLAKAGGIVLGVDYDIDAVLKGREIAKNMGIEDMTYWVTDIKPRTIRDLDTYGVVVWLSQWQWFVKQHGLEAGLQALFEVSQKSEVLVFESASSDGRAGIEGSTQDAIHSWLIKNTLYSKIERYKGKNDEWNKRDIFICSKPIFKWRRHRTVLITRTERNVVVKQEEKGKLSEEMQRCITCYQRLKGTGITPDLLDFEDDRIIMTYGGIVTPKLDEEDIQRLLKVLRENKIVHRDIIPSNLLWDGEKVVLIDFAWAVLDGNDYEPSKNTGSEFKSPNGFDDEYSLRKIKEYLDKKALKKS